MTDLAERQQPQEDHRFFGQPLPLANLFGVEMWERFSFYGMQGILLLYLWYGTDQGGLGIDQTTAAGIVGAYGGTVYLSTILGAWAADRLIGPERTLFYSAVLVMAGHVALSLLPGVLGVGVGLVLIAIGSGGIKANATSLVGTLYRPDDPRRDAGFSLFYLGINLGALTGPLVTGLLQTEYGFEVGFGVAAVGMAAGLVQYSFGRKHFSPAAHVVVRPLPASERTRVVLVAVGALALVAVLVLTGVLTAARLSTAVVLLVIVATVAYFSLMLRSSQLDAVERRRVLAFVPMFVASAAFWSLYQQQFTVLTIYSADQLDRDVLGWTMPVTWVQSINPVFIIVLSGAFAALWTKLGDRQPSTPVKFALATVVMGVAFLLFLPFSSPQPDSTPLLAMIGILFVFTVAELLLAPVGLSLATKLAPRAFHTQMVALFFLSVALGTALSGTLERFYSTDAQARYFGTLGLIAIALGAALLALTPMIKRLMGGVR